MLATYGTIAVFTSGYAYAQFRYSDSLYFVKKQTLWLSLGIITMFISKKINTSVLKKIAPLAYTATLILLGLTLIVGFVGNGAKRWISLGPITIQPSEIAKLTMVMMIAKYFSDNEALCLERLNSKAMWIIQ